MLASPTRASEIVPPSTLTAAATPTIGHWWAIRTNFSCAAPHPVCFGIRTSVRISSSPIAVSNRSTKKSSASTVRVPPGPAITN